MPDVKMVPCPVCGQQIDPAADVCPFCRITLRQNAVEPIPDANVTNQPQLRNTPAPRQAPPTRTKKTTTKKNPAANKKQTNPSFGTFLLWLLFTPFMLTNYAIKKKKWYLWVLVLIVWYFFLPQYASIFGK